MDPFVTKIWPVMVFHGSFSIITVKLVKPHTSFFSGLFFHITLNIAANIFVSS